MIGNTHEVAIDLVMAALSTLLTEVTDGDAGKQETLKLCQRVEIEVSTFPLVIRLHAVDGDGEAILLGEFSDSRPVWSTWANELGLRAQ